MKIFFSKATSKIRNEEDIKSEDEGIIQQPANVTIE